MNSDATPSTTYGSVEDLPSFIEMRRMLSGLKVLGWLKNRGFRQDIRDLEDNLDQLSSQVDSFYRLLGSRGWIYHDELNTDHMRKIAALTEPEQAERELLSYYVTSDQIEWSLRRANRHEAMRPRIDLAEKALADYRARRYYSTVLVLLTVADGFVNDFDRKTRKGLHARDSSTMSPWDSVAGHHQGLASVHRTLVGSVGKLDTTEQTSLRRNGIVHGMLPNFDNPVAATKAWNLLFAVLDWADAENKRLAPKPEERPFRAVLADYADLQRRKKLSARFEAYEWALEGAASSSLREVETVETFLLAWHERRWDAVSNHFLRMGIDPVSDGQRAAQARQLYEPFPLTKWRVVGVRRNSSSLAHVDVELNIDNEEHRGSVRLLLSDDEGEVELNPDAGTWRVAPYVPSSFWESDTA